MDPDVLFRNNPGSTKKIADLILSNFLTTYFSSPYFVHIMYVPNIHVIEYLLLVFGHEHRMLRKKGNKPNVQHYLPVPKAVLKS